MSGHDQMPNAMRCALRAKNVALLKTQDDLRSARAKLAAKKQAREAEHLRAKLATAKIVHALKSELAAEKTAAQLLQVKLDAAEAERALRDRLAAAEMRLQAGSAETGLGDDAEQSGGASGAAAEKAQDQTTSDLRAELAATEASLQAEYTRRGEAVMALLALARERGYPIGVRVDPEDDPRGEWPVVTARLPTGEVSWHMPRAAVPHFDAMGAAPAWDGSTVEDVSARLRTYAANVLAKKE